MNTLILYKLGLNEKEIELYIQLVEGGVQTVKQLSDKTNVNRTTAYRYLDSLGNKGLVEWIIDERGNKIKAAEPENFNLLLNKQKNQIKEIEGLLPNFVAQLKLSKPIQKLQTQIRYYKDKTGIKQMIWNTLRASETMRSYANLKRREYIDSRFEDKFENEWAQKNIKDLIITTPDRLPYVKKAMVKDYKKMLKIRTIPKKKLYITNDIAIYNNTVAIISLEKGSLVGVEIENAEIAKTQKSIFDLVWNIAQPLES
jgi:sugar-specific transcriptional regulator TrmB